MSQIWMLLPRSYKFCKKKRCFTHIFNLAAQRKAQTQSAQSQGGPQRLVSASEYLTSVKYGHNLSFCFWVKLLKYRQEKVFC